jgi:uncharacterized protein (TIGR03435 family)
MHLPQTRSGQLSAGRRIAEPPTVTRSCAAKGVCGWWQKLIPASLVLVMFNSSPSLAQPSRRLTFDAVSIKPNHSGVTWASASPIKNKVGRYTARNVTLKALIAWFYNVYEAQIVGGPRWLDVDRFDIEAEVDGQPSREELIQMLQALLADRFQLQVRFESREISRYALMAPKGGLKFGPHLARADDRDCSNSPESAGCRGVTFGPQNMSMEHTDFAIVARTLSSMIGRVVVDETGLTGSYDIKLDLDLTLPEGGPALSFGDTVMAAFREQIGIRFESEKGPAEVLVVDRAERPSEN